MKVHLVALALVASGCLALGDDAVSPDEPSVRPDGPASFSHVERGSFANGNPGHSTIRRAIDAEPEWRAFWDDYGEGRDPRPPLPAIDFQERFVVAVSRGAQGSAGYDVDVVRIDWNGNYTVRYDHTDPASHCGTAAVLTHPIHIVSVERMGTGEPRAAFVINASKTRDCSATTNQL